MKKMKYTLLIISVMLFGLSASSQSLYDANRLMDSDLNGTSRFVGMGGAMGALGGDISTIGTNPAGIGIYRSSDAMITFGFGNVGNKATLNGTTVKDNKNFGTFNNAGFVLAVKQGDFTPLRFVNFGLNYHRLKSFNRNMAMSGRLNGEISQADQMLDLANKAGAANFGGDYSYNNDRISWLSVMGYHTYLINPGETTQPNGNPILDDNNQPITDDNGNPLYYNYTDHWTFISNPMTQYSSSEKGGVDSYDINVALNFHDRVYVGATIGLLDVDYTRSSLYSEAFDAGNYSLENWFQTVGVGVNFKVGAIVRATDNLRVGAAIHIPTFYYLSDYHSARLSANYTGEQPIIADTYKAVGDAETDYEMTTPWKFNVNLGYTIGRNIALGAEYEYMDRSTAKLRYDDGVSISHENERIKTGLKAVHTLRLGGEYRVTPQFSLRAGYNLITAPMYADTFKQLDYNTIRTDTEFSNIKAMSNYTLGLGYRGNFFYADMAYKYQTGKEDFYAFDHENLPATAVDNNNHQLMLTLGMRF